MLKSCWAQEPTFGYICFNHLPLQVTETWLMPLINIVPWRMVPPRGTEWHDSEIRWSCYVGAQRLTCGCFFPWPKFTHVISQRRFLAHREIGMWNVSNHMKLFSWVRTVLRCFGSIKDDGTPKWGIFFKEPADVGCEYGVCSSIIGSCWTFSRTWQSLPSSLLKSRMGCCSRVNTAVRLVQEICSCPANLNIAHLTTHATKMCASICKLTWHVQFCFCHSAGIHILESLYIIQSPSHQGKTHQVIWGDYQSKLQKSSPPKKNRPNSHLKLPNQDSEPTTQGNN